jgi:hypothetical protein
MLIFDTGVAFITSVAFDQAQADALVQELGSEVVKSPKIEAYQWDNISVVIELEPQERAFGYVYWNGSEWEAAGPSFDALDKAEELRDAMRTPGKAHWKKALVQISRATGKIDIDFDYTGDKWVPNMADPKGFALSLKPAA